MLADGFADAITVVLLAGTPWNPGPHFRGATTRGPLTRTSVQNIVGILHLSNHERRFLRDQTAKNFRTLYDLD